MSFSLGPNRLDKYGNYRSNLYHVHADHYQCNDGYHSTVWLHSELWIHILSVLGHDLRKCRFRRKQANHHRLNGWLTSVTKKMFNYFVYQHLKTGASSKSLAINRDHLAVLLGSPSGQISDEILMSLFQRCNLDERTSHEVGWFWGNHLRLVRSLVFLLGFLCLKFYTRMSGEVFSKKSYGIICMKNPKLSV